MTDGDAGKDDSLRLTRSSTIFHALLRIFGSSKLPSRLVLHIVGSDHREGRTPEQTRSVFADLFHRLGQVERVRDVNILFCGPNIGTGLHGTSHSFSHNLHAETGRGRNIDHSSNNSSSSGGAFSPPAEEPINHLGEAHRAVLSEVAVTLHYDAGLYHDVAGLFAAPHAMFLFNAGLWGYDDWVPTIEYALGCDGSSSPATDTVHSGPVTPPGRPTSSRPASVIVVTSYCAEEAEDDMETLERVLLRDGRCKCFGLPTAARPQEDGSADDVDGLEWLWKPEVNPHRSSLPRRTACGVEGRILFENHSWQALRPPRHTNRTLN